VTREADAASHAGAGSDVGAEIAALEVRLERRFRTARTVVPVQGWQVELLHPANPEELISEEEFERDERLPYWADVWPSAHALAARVVTADGRGRSAIEFGCGVGLVAAAAARAGFDVTATDYYDDALLFARVNVWANAHARLWTRHVDWRALPADLGRYDLVLASDVLYERPYAAMVAEAVERTLAPGGAAVIADPGRVARDDFLAESRRRGLLVREAEPVPFAAGEIRQTITVFELGWRP
jgi:predicted nicotinamide N-methyase